MGMRQYASYKKAQVTASASAELSDASLDTSTTNYMLTLAQAQMFRRLYTRTVNQNHVQEWAQNTLRHDQASPVIGKIKVLSKVFWEENPNEWKEIQLWGRMKIRELGYKEEEQPKSL